MNKDSHIRKIRTFERKYTRQVYNILRNEFIATAEKLRTGGLDAAFQYANRIIIVEGIGEKIQSIYKEVGLWVAGRTMRDINRSAKGIETKAGFGFSEKWLRAILEYFRFYLLKQAVLPISNTTRITILNILEEAQRGGWGVDKILSHLEDIDIPLSRARAIVRTEVLKAQFYGTELGRGESIFETEQVWIASDDARTRRSHNEMDNKTIKEGQKFKVPVYRGKKLIGYDYMIGPGDPTASAGNIINCRCTRAVRAVRDSNGNLVRKKQKQSRISVILPDNRIHLPVITI